jgi:hypothetical protein
MSARIVTRKGEVFEGEFVRRVPLADRDECEVGVKLSEHATVYVPEREINHDLSHLPARVGWEISSADAGPQRIPDIVEATQVLGDLLLANGVYENLAAAYRDAETFVHAAARHGFVKIGGVRVIYGGPR